MIKDFGKYSTKKNTAPDMYDMVKKNIANDCKKFGYTDDKIKGFERDFL